MLYAWQVVQFGAGISRLRAMHAFYEELLEVPDVSGPSQHTPSAGR
jgi:hypothetical protein